MDNLLLYNLLFCDDLNVYCEMIQDHSSYPWNILLNAKEDRPGLLRIIEDQKAETRVKLLACRKLFASGHQPAGKELLGVIVEVGLEAGLDVLAAYRDGTARYINHSGKMIIWEASDDQSTELTNELFRNAENIVRKIGPWDKERCQPPQKGFARISFLVSDGLYFGEAPMEVLFNDALAGPALNAALNFVSFLTERAMNNNQ